ncbi:hypothetical protein HRR83_007109 [Exophiala dermatitidis]|uniref:NAD(P)-binding protein n=2 Tax=Exophiala dermatitidis TaxID=5970 RepID=H6C4T9_EXODN|nr:uncharacterized protein HMPREF1120_06526 [Exophiala dermatitidis NIH/UT8656]KAJ4509203.1 hypothetical protein HRR75_006174 [Exophiala dermatitidis]EHY58516.1 hypothetical protein HMPREF1120_06526 [Exophiala dermatitidis NIH/UT8656]KAJ4511070.1 hypothetical protein HRR73_006401 [Exophiala dermatitidis]KAJ4511995.1 hypothetical protein HRR74_006731 [Exophiala dermatitidis]KAJ4534860.1 hypothetical protein HRR76_006767 [Exophiala dermatitidis]
MNHPSFTKTYHKASYPAIDPSRPELSAKDKTVIVTGAGAGGIGAAVAHAFAKAGAQKIALVGRTEATLQQTKDAIVQAHPDATVYVAVADVSKAESVGLAAHNIRVEIGAWNVFAHCAAVLPRATTLVGADEDDWFSAFETNVKFSAHFAKHFLPKRRPNATYIGINAGAAHVPPSQLPGASAYSASKLAAAKLDEYLAYENPELRVFTVHPGIVLTNMARKALGDKKDSFPESILDAPELPANFLVWLASPEADFLRGRYLWANWDVEELIARKAEIEGNPHLLTITLGGWPFK